MNKTAEQLKKRLEEIFDATTERSSLLAETAMDVPIDDKTQKAFDFLEKETLEIISTNLKNGDTFCWPDDDYFLHLRTLLSFKPYFIYPSWHTRDDITEDELLALENEIIAEDLPKLEPLRSPTRQQDFEMPMLNTYWKFKTHLSNTRYMIVVLIHIAKHFNAPSAAKSLLRVASLLHWERLTDVPNFRPSPHPSVGTSAPNALAMRCIDLPKYLGRVTANPSEVLVVPFRGIGRTLPRYCLDPSKVLVVPFQGICGVLALLCK